MTPEKILTLSRPAARSVYEFCLLPALGMHPDRVARLIPLTLQASSPAARSAGVMAQLGIPQEVALRLDDVAHRAALLPSAALQALGRYLLLRAATPMLRRLIIKHELEQLSAHLQDEDWQVVFSGSVPLLPQALSNVQWLSQPEALAQAFDQGATPLLEWASYALPAAIGLRMRLKLPIGPWSGLRPEDGLPQACHSFLQAHYATHGPGWDPQPWETLWSSVQAESA
jgi:hypothetical protein